MLTVNSQGGGEKVSFETSDFINERLVFGTAACVVAVVVVKITAGRGFKSHRTGFSGYVE
jgi:hypothetical protein